MRRFNVLQKGRKIGDRSLKIDDKSYTHELHLYTVEDPIGFFATFQTFGCATCKDTETCCAPFLQFLNEITLSTTYKIARFDEKSLPFLLPLNRFKTIWAPVVFWEEVPKSPSLVHIASYNGDKYERECDVGFFYTNEPLSNIIEVTSRHLSGIDVLDDSDFGGVGCRHPDEANLMTRGSLARLVHNLFVIHYGRCEKCLLEDVEYQTLVGRDFW